VAKIVSNENFLFKLQPSNPSLPCAEKELKKEKKNEVCYHNVMFKNYKEQLPNNLKRWGAKNELLK
jgi:hypothetical protein